MSKQRHDIGYQKRRKAKEEQERLANARASRRRFSRKTREDQESTNDQ